MLNHLRATATGRALTALLLVSGATTATAATAFAAPVAPTADTGGSAAGQVAGQCSSIDWLALASNLLPGDRWAGSMGFHSRQYQSMNPAQVIDHVNSGVVGTSLSVGNAGWQAGGFMSKQASQFCIGTNVMAVLDLAAGRLGRAIMDSPLLMLAVVAALVGGIWRARSGRNMPWRSWARLLACVAVLGLFTSTAAQSRPGHLAQMSPAWVVEKVDAGVSSLAVAPLKVINDMANEQVAQSSPSTWATDVKTSASSCTVYEEVLRRMYAKSTTDLSVGSATAMVPTVLDTMWTASGLNTWQRIQLGDSGPNDYPGKTRCKLLEYMHGTQPSQVHGTVDDGTVSVFKARPATSSDAVIANEGFQVSYKGERKNVEPDSLAFHPISNDEVDDAMVAWAACNVAPDGTLSVRPAWAKLATKPVTLEDCRDFFTAKTTSFGGTFSPNGSTFMFSDKPDEARKRIGGDQEVVDFVMALHGENAGVDQASAFVYAGSSWVVNLIFMALALVVVVCKIAVRALVVIFFLQLLVLCFRADDDLSGLARLGKRMLLMCVGSAAGLAVMSFIAFVTGLLSGIGTQAAGLSGVGASLWVASAPIAALVVTHLMFTRVLKVSSPLTPSGFKQYAAALSNPETLSRAGAVGSAMGSRLRGDRGTGRGANRSTTSASRAAQGRASAAPVATRKGDLSPVKTALAAAGGVLAADKARGIMAGRKEAKTIREQATRPDGVLPNSTDLGTLALDADSANRAEAFARRGGHAPIDRSTPEGRRADDRLLADNRKAFNADRRQHLKQQVRSRLDVVGRAKESAGRLRGDFQVAPVRTTARTLAKAGVAVGVGTLAASAVVPMAAAAGVAGVGVAGAGIVAGELGARYANRKLGLSRPSEAQRMRRQHGISMATYEHRKQMVASQLEAEREGNRRALAERQEQQRSAIERDGAERRRRWQDEQAEQVAWDEPPADPVVPVHPVAQPEPAPLPEPPVDWDEPTQPVVSVQQQPEARPETVAQQPQPEAQPAQPVRRLESDGSRFQ